MCLKDVQKTHYAWACRLIGHQIQAGLSSYRCPQGAKFLVSESYTRLILWSYASSLKDV